MEYPLLTQAEHIREDYIKQFCKAEIQSHRMTLLNKCIAISLCFFMIYSVLPMILFVLPENGSAVILAMLKVECYWSCLWRLEK